MANYQDFETRLTKALGLSRAPVAVTFLDAEPKGVRKFMGQVPSGCSFWKLAASSPAFYTVPQDHYNCPIGSYTHQIALPKEREHELSDVLGFMAKIGYVKMEEVPQIPRVEKAPKAIVYARLGEAPVPPDAVVLAVNARGAMLLNEASRECGKSSDMTLPRPTCMAIPAAQKAGTTLSLACIGNRVYTEVSDNEIYAFIRGADLEAITAALGKIVDANQQLTQYHQERKPKLLQV